MDYLVRHGRDLEMEIFQFEKQKMTKKKSLTLLSIHFLKNFFKENKSFSLRQYIKELNKNKMVHLKVKNKMRRLYDIINIFKSFGLV